MKINAKPFYQRIWFIVVVLLLLVGGIGYYFVSKKTASIIEDNLRLALNKNPNRLYLLEFKKLKISPLKGDFSIHDISIKPNPKALDSLEKIEVHLSLLAEVKIKSIKLRSFDIEGLIDNQTIKVDKFIIENPEFVLNITGYKKVKKDTIEPIEALYKIAERIQNLQVNSIEIKNANLLVSKNINEVKDTLVIAKGISLKVEDIKVDTAKENIPIDLNEMKLNVKSVWVKVNTVYDIELKSLNASFKDSSISIESFALIPKITKEKFSRGLKFEKTWQKISCGNITIVGFDIDDFLFKKKLVIRKVELHDPYIYVYKDKTPEWPTHKKHTIPHALLKKLKIDLNIKQMVLKNGEVHFEQKRPDRNSIGKFNLTKMYATVYNVTNSKPAIYKSKWLTVDAEMKLMGSGKMKANIKFDYTSSSNNWFLKASIGKMDFANLNPLIYPLTDVEVLRGDLIDVNLFIDGNELTAIGKMDMQYKNAKLNINKFDKETGSIQHLEVVSFVANGIIRTTNIKNLSSYKRGNISHTRTKDHPFIKFLWSSIQTGLIDTFVGLKNKKEREINKSKSKKRKRKKKK